MNRINVSIRLYSFVHLCLKDLTLRILFINLFVNLRSRKPFKFWRADDDRTISDHDLSVSQCGAGFGYGFSRPTPPVSKNLQTSSSISPLLNLNLIIKDYFKFKTTDSYFPFKI